MLKYKIKELRKKQNLTQKQLSELSGLSLRTIQYLESNEMNISIEKLDKLKNALQLQSIDDLITK